MQPTRVEFNALLRSDLASFVQKVFATVEPRAPFLPNWHIEAIAWHLQLCQRGRIKRLIITLPPRSLKSIIASVAFPAWVHGHDPSKHIICVSYSQNLANKHALDNRAVLESAWYQTCFPQTRILSDKNAVTEFMTTRRGSRLTTSVGGTLTGRGGDLIIIDDPHKADEGILSEVSRTSVHEWYRNTLSSRLNNKKEDVMVLIQQRLHEDDLAGYLLGTGEWTHLNIPAIAEEAESIPIGEQRVHRRQIGDVLHPEREPLAVLEALQRTLGSYNFAAQYQQHPAPMGGGLVKWAWLKTYENQPAKGYGDEIIQSWDTASKAEAIHDWSVCTTWLCHAGTFHLLHVLRERLEFTALKQRIIGHAEYWGADAVLMEDKGAGTSLIQDIGQSSRLNVIPILPEGDKATRMLTVTPMMEAGKVYIPTEALWLADLQRELVNFPKGKHDDQVDSVSQFLNWARDHAWLPDMHAAFALNDRIPKLWACSDDSPWGEHEY